MRFLSIALSCLVGLAALFAAAPAKALDEFQRIKSNDLVLNDGFGSAVGLSGNTAVVGSWRDDLPGKGDAGSAYVFRNPGSGTFSQLDHLFADDAAIGDMFGTSVAISGSTAIIGAPQRAGGGGAYIFRDNGAGDWVQIDKVFASNATAGDEFGYSVAIAGDTAIVGAWKRGTSTGAAYVFRDNGAGDWSQVGGPLVANDAATGAQFGVSVAISGTTALVGASFDTNFAALSGAVYVFQESSGNWNQVGKLMPNDPSLAKQFGNSVALSGSTAVIGASGDSGSATNAGSAYVFHNNGSAWVQQDKLLPSDPTVSGQFGISVGVSGNTAVVGANQATAHGTLSGAAYLFRDNGAGQWNQLRKLEPSDGLPSDWVGYSSAISGDVALAGAVLANDSVAGNDAGAGYLYHVPGPVLAGDYNADNKVNAADYTVWRNTAGQTGVALAADGNGDGVVNRTDYDLWKRNLGQMIATGSFETGQGVPEPATAALGVFALIYVAFARSRRNDLG